MKRIWKCDGCGDLNEYVTDHDRQCQMCGGYYYLTDDSDILFSDLPHSEN